MRFFKRGETVDSKFTFRDVVTDEAIDVDDAQYTITYYDGPNEIEVVALTSLTKISGKTGEYICSWEIPDTAIENETYFVTASGVHPIRTTPLSLDDMFRVIPITYFGDVSNGGMTAKFTKP
jgi:hypothetical protein